MEENKGDDYMVLKEAFRYSNYLSTLITEAQDYFYDVDKCFEIKETHKRSAACTNAVDEEITVTDGTNQTYSLESVIKFIRDAINEKEKLMNAIEKCKSENCPFCDSEIQVNKVIYNVVNYLGRISSSKDRTSTRIGRGYTFNVEGSQTMYQYDIDVERKAKFDRKELKETIRELRSFADERSMKVDQLFTTTEMDFTPMFDVNDSFDDIMETYI